jgi:hypothetical protein
METEHAAIATQFAVSENSAFLGQAIHDYNGWKAMRKVKHGHVPYAPEHS